MPICAAGFSTTGRSEWCLGGASLFAGVRFGLEVQLDKIAVALGKNPADRRLQQLTESHGITANYLKRLTINFADAMNR